MTVYTVVLVDDEPIAVEGLLVMIDWPSLGFQVTGIYHTGQDAYEHIRRDPPDLVVTDIRMPLMDGLELIEHTRNQGNRETQFILTSGFSDFSYARRALHMGVSSYLVKPILDGEARIVLDSVLDKLREREQQAAIRLRAGSYAIHHALSILLFGGDEQEMGEAMIAAASWAQEAEGWAYIHVEADVPDMALARETALSLAEDSVCCQWIHCAPDAFGLVIGWRHQEDAHVRSFAQQLLSSLKQHSIKRPSIAVGCGVDRLEELGHSAASAQEAGRFLFYGKTDIVFYDEIKDLTLSFDSEVLQAADEIVDVVENGSANALSRVIQGAMCRFESQVTAPELVDMFMVQVVLRCAALYKEMGGDPDELLALWDRHQADGRSMNLKAMGQRLEEFCLHGQKVCSALSSRHSGGVIRKTADYLRLHYAEPITIKEIAERFFVNPVYLGQSFSRRFGMGILDFIHDLRIEDAAKRLLGGDEPSAAIAEKVGYRGYQQFLKHFEKRKGMKPGEFRILERDKANAEL